MLTNKNTKFKKRMVIAGIVTAAVAAVIPGASSSAWGPERTTFTMKDPADYITFNSITDNAGLGDERNFVRIREAGTNDPYRDSVNVVPGKEYEVYVYFHNDGKSSLNNTGVGLATGVHISSALSAWDVNASQKVKVSAVVKANNSKPLEVWDEAYLTTTYKDDIALRYVAGSATMHNNYKMNGAALSSDHLFSADGVSIGENELDGVIPACAEFAGYITYRLRADQAGSKISKTVSKDGKTFYESLDAKPGDTLTYKIEWENTGTVDLSNVTFHDKLPAGVTLVPGTTIYKNVFKNTETKMADEIGTNGFSIGLYGPTAKAIITYQVKVNEDVVNDKECNKRNEFKNTVYATYNIGKDDQVGEVSDGSTVYITKTCGDNPPDEPEPECAEGDKDCICKEDPKNEICSTPVTPDTPELPKTGPGEIALAIVAVICIATGGIYWYRSQREVSKLHSNITNKDSNSGDGGEKTA